MNDLATISDVEARLGRSLTDAETLRCATLLGDASAAVAGWTGQDFARTERTAYFWWNGNPYIDLRGKDVASVSAVDEDDNAVDVEQVSATRWLTGGWVRKLTVTYTDGWDGVPRDIVAVVAQVVGRALGVALDATAITQESTGPFSVSYGAAGSSGALGFLPSEQAVLNRYRVSGPPSTIGVRPWVG